jgi:hypothetical protein
MSEVASFGNIVNSLLSLRENYHEQLKSVPQYEAYLLVQSATEKAAGALNASAESPASIAAEVIDSLQFARSRFEQHLNSVPEYRTLLAIDKLIKEIAIDLGIIKPEQASAPDVPEAEVAAVAPEPVSAIPAEPEPDEIVAAAEAEPEEAETAAPPPVEAPVQPSRVMTIDIDEALAADELAADDDFVSVHVPRRETETAIEGGEDDDLLEVSHRGAAGAEDSAKDADVAADEPRAARASHPKAFDEDADEAAA